MAVYIVGGKSRIGGSVRIHGAKNAALPILAAAVICGACVIENCPDLTDVAVALDILQHLGCRVVREGGTVYTHRLEGGDHCIPDALMSAMRSSIVFLGGIIARHGKAEVTLPGGCELGKRPIDIHLAALRRMGVRIREKGSGTLVCSAPRGLQGTELALPFPSVGATENIIIAAVTARGTTRITGAAREPEIRDLIAFLNGCGAQITCEVDGTITIQGVEKLHGVTHRVIPDRIAAGTFLCAAAITGGSVEVQDVNPGHLLSTLAYLNNAGCSVTTRIDSVLLRGPERLNELGIVKTLPYPGFPTDMQAVLMAAAAGAKGTSVFVENIFDGRYRHVSELLKLGADIRVLDRVAVVTGVPELHGGQLRCTDLRGGAAVVLAALSAQGPSVIREIRHIDRGYEDFSGSLRALGADIRREEAEWNGNTDQSAASGDEKKS